MNDIGIARRQLLKLAAGAGVLLAGEALGQQVYKEIHDLQPGEFTWHPERQPEGPVAVIVSIDEQRVHVYRNGVRIAVSTCSTGKPGHETPTGVFVVLQKDRNHRSSTYGGAPMPNMNRLTWDGIALHAGQLPGYPASHGCVRLPGDFSALLYGITHLGTPVIIASSHHEPWELVHPGLILSGYAESEYEQVLAGLEEKMHPSDWKDTMATRFTSILVSSYDKQVLLLENNRVAGGAELLYDGGPFGSHVYVLQGAHDAQQGMHWSAMAYGGRTGDDLSLIKKVRTTKDFSRYISTRMHPGTILILTDLPLHPDTRSGADFVIMS